MHRPGVDSRPARRDRPPARLAPGSLGAIIGQFKAASTKRIRAAVDPAFGWQPRFHDRILRDAGALQHVRRYIAANPARWERERSGPGGLGPERPGPSPSGVHVLDTQCDNTYICRMTPRLQEEIRQSRPFESREQEAHLGILRTAAALDHAVADALRPHGVTPTQYNVLRILRGAGEAGLCRNEVRERMVALVPDATRLLDRMESAGLIRRQRGTEDRRFVTTRITAEGLRLLSELDAPVQALHRRHLGHLDAAELETLVGLLDRVRAAL